MKHLCYSKLFLLLFILLSPLFASINSKSAFFYYGENISYPMVGIHDYIVVDSENTDRYQHGFKLYKEKIYARIPLEKNLDLVKINLEKANKNGFENFFLDESEERLSKREVSSLVSYVYSKYSGAKIILHAKHQLNSSLYEVLTALVMDAQTSLSEEEVARFKGYGLDIISIQIANMGELDDERQSVKRAEAKGVIPYVSASGFEGYGISSKNALKREVFTLIDKRSAGDKKNSLAHKAGALPLEYLGYIQKLYDISQGLPEMEEMQHYAGVVIWLENYYDDGEELMIWLKDLQRANIKFVFVRNFGFSGASRLLNSLGISLRKGDDTDERKKQLLYTDSMIGFEIEPSTILRGLNIEVKNAEPLVIYEDSTGKKSIPAAITPWGGYSVYGSFMAQLEGESLWVVNPFEFFTKVLRLKKLLVPDTTTQNAKRLLFTRVNNEGMLYTSESRNRASAGEVITKEILNRYNLPYSLSKICNADRSNLKNVEYSTKESDKLSNRLLFWSDNYEPTRDELRTLSKHNILNINGGNTWINNTTPWLTHVSPLGLEHSGYHQVYATAHDETYYTHYWKGPFWGYKRVVETFKLTENPRRLKPIDIHYHAYSGSKLASLNALKYVFRWALSQDVYPIFTSEYIPKVMDYFTVSMANSGELWLIDGMRDLKTLRLSPEIGSVDMMLSPTLYGYKKSSKGTYINLNKSKTHLLAVKKGNIEQKRSYLISSNASVVNHIKGKKIERYSLEGYLDIEVEFYLTKGCNIDSIPKVKYHLDEDSKVSLLFKNCKKASVDVICK